MKKFLLGTTGLVAAATMFASVAVADTPKVTVGGFADFQAGIANDDADSGQRHQGFRNDSEIDIRVDGKSDMGLGYGAEIDLEADVTADADNEGFNASRTYVFLDGGFGRFEMGSNTGASQALKIDAASIARATGGIDGAWHYFVGGLQGNAASGSLLASPFLTAPSLPVAHGSTLVAGGDEQSENNNKITYYSPRWAGFQLGVSYAPDQTDRGQFATRLKGDGGAGNIVDGGVSYNGQWDQFSFGLAATGEWGQASTAGQEDLMAWNAGGKVGFMGFSVAGSYGDWNDSLNADGSDAHYWTAGGAYEMGLFGVSATYLRSVNETGGGDDKFDNISVGADYKLAPGLTPYAEVSFYDFNAAGTVPDNTGRVLILGTQLAF